MLARLRLMNEHDFASYDSGGEGLYRRVYRAVQEGGSLGDILTRATTKRYPTARVRRMLWAVFLGLEAPERTSPMSEFWPPQRRGEGSCGRCRTQVRRC